jgi:hypothetical protein
VVPALIWQANELSAIAPVAGNVEDHDGQYRDDEDVEKKDHDDTLSACLLRVKNEQRAASRRIGGTPFLKPN